MRHKHTHTIYMYTKHTRISNGSVVAIVLMMLHVYVSMYIYIHVAIYSLFYVVCSYRDIYIYTILHFIMYVLSYYLLLKMLVGKFLVTNERSSDEQAHMGHLDDIQTALKPFKISEKM